MAATNHDTRFVFGLLIEILRERVNLEAKLFGAKQLGVVFAGVHTKDNGIEVLGNLFRMPTYFLWKKTGCCQIRLGGIENLVVRTSYVIAFF